MKIVVKSKKHAADFRQKRTGLTAEQVKLLKGFFFSMSEALAEVTNFR